MVNNSKSPAAKPLLVGSVLALVSAITFALNMVLAGMSYHHGANIHALNLSRAGLFFGCLAIYIVTTRTPLTLPPRIRVSAILVGALLCGEMYVLLGAIQTIQVALAVLIFYTYPMLVAMIHWITGKERFSPIALLLLVCGFSGLVFVLITAPVQPDTLGIVYSVLAALVMTAMLITSESSLRAYNNQVVLLHSLAVVVVIVLLLSVTIVDINWPATRTGWAVFTGSTVFYVIATFTLFKAVSIVGPLRTAIIDNTAPVWAIVFGYLLLGEVLNGWQIVGVAIVIAAVITLQIVKKES
jgi:drug/metabolite transporter (DMT)-like permease